MHLAWKFFARKTFPATQHFLVFGFVVQVDAVGKVLSEVYKIGGKRRCFPGNSMEKSVENMSETPLLENGDEETQQSPEVSVTRST